jgi:hypothetical protein
MGLYKEEQFILDKTVEQIASCIAPCGYICGMCYATENGYCRGCLGEDEICPIRVCCKAHDIRGCWECPAFPCCECKFHRSVRFRGFLQCAREEGIIALAGYLLRNLRRDIHYNRGDTYKGDYDTCNTVEEVLAMLRCGQK